MIEGLAIQTVHLFDAPEIVPILVRWFVDEWEPWYGPNGPGDAEADLAACRTKDALPLCLVALGRKRKLYGTAALRTESAGSETGVGPWLAGLLVAPKYRGQGIALALVEAIEAEARRLGFQAIYCSTDSAEGVLRRRSWQQVGFVGTLRGHATIYRCDI